MIRPNWKISLWAALSLWVLLLSLAAIVNPYAAHSTDDWNYFRDVDGMVQTGNWGQELAGRQFPTIHLALTYLLFPHQFETFYYVHLLCLYLAAYGLFYYLALLQPDQLLFALATAFFFLTYIPYNGTWVMSWLAPYSFPLALLMLSVCCYGISLSFDGRAKWGWLVVGLGMGYVAMRAHESTIAFMGLLPLLAFLQLPPAQRWANRFTLVIWWGVVGLAILQFLRTLSQVSYQTTFLEDKSVNYLTEARLFFEAAFPFTAISHLQITFALPSLLGSLLGGVALWRFQQGLGKKMLTHTQSLQWLAVGLLGSLMGGLGFIYAGIADYPRGQMFAALGTALVLSSGLSLLAHWLKALLHLSPILTFLGGVAVLIFCGGQWYHDANAISVRYGLPFDEKMHFYQEVLALTTQVEDHTLILLVDCHLKTDYPRQVASSHAFDRASLLYNPRQTQVALSQIEKVFFNLRGASVTLNLSKNEPQIWSFGYGEMVILGCQGEVLSVLERFPEGYTHPSFLTAEYNPYARLKAGFFPERGAEFTGY